MPRVREHSKIPQDKTKKMRIIMTRKKKLKPPKKLAKTQ